MKVTTPLIIAEAGVNHNGDLDTALRLVDAAADAGADIVKFQTFKAEHLVTGTASKAEYQKRNEPGAPDSQLEMLRRLELSPADHLAIIDRCDSRGIRFLSTPFDLESVDFLASLGLTLWKIPSGEITNYLLLRKIGSLGGDVILSTGMSTIGEVEQAVEVLTASGQERSRITLLHCTTQYPTPFADVNLRAMDTLREHFGLPAGYSDHTLGIEVPVAAAARGASVIEKHFTLSRSLPGPDHRASLEPDELRQMVASVRNVALALGSPLKQPSASELPNIAVARKSIVAARQIKKGEILTEESLTVKRPGTGLSPMRWPEVVGTRATRDYLADEPIELI